MFEKKNVGQRIAPLREPFFKKLPFRGKGRCHIRRKGMGTCLPKRTKPEKKKRTNPTAGERKRHKGGRGKKGARFSTEKWETFLGRKITCGAGGRGPGKNRVKVRVARAEKKRAANLPLR